MIIGNRSCWIKPLLAFKRALRRSRHAQRYFDCGQPRPSGTNTQPWKVYVLTGKKRDELVQRVCQAQMELYQNPALAEQYKETNLAYYPEQWFSPYIDRRRENGWGLYGLLNIQKGEKKKWRARTCVIFELFDAPVGLFFTLHKDLGIGSKWIFP